MSGPKTPNDLLAFMENQDAGEHQHGRRTASIAREAEDGDDDSDSDDEWNEEEHATKVTLAVTDEKTRRNHHLSIRRLLLFLFEDPEDMNMKRLLHPTVVNAFQAIKERTANTKNKKAFDDTALSFAETAGPRFHPIDLKVFTAKDFIRFLCSLTDVKNHKYRSHYGDLRSALNYLYVKCELQPTQQFKTSLKGEMKRIRNLAAKAREATGDNGSVDKKPLPFQAYRQICQWLLESEGDEAIFAHSFLTVTWNLMCRTKNTVTIHRRHMSWTDDCLSIDFAHTSTSTDNAADGSIRARHLYANPYIPEICVATSLGRYFAAFPTSWDNLLFPGADPYSRFLKIFKSVVSKHAAELKRLGIDSSDIGVNSIRKGAAAYACNDTSNTVSFAAVCLRAGWSAGNVQDSHMHKEASDDHVVGRIVSGMNVMSPNFLVSPPLFVTAANQKPTEQDVDRVIEQVWGQASEGHRHLLRFLLASLCYHRDFHLQVSELDIDKLSSANLQASLRYSIYPIQIDFAKALGFVLPFYGISCQQQRSNFHGTSQMIVRPYGR